MVECPPLLAVAGLSAGYGRTRIVSDVTIRIDPGMWVGLLGANGSGKSTLLKAITGQIALQDGQVHVAGIDIAKSPEQAKRLLGYAVDGADLPEGLTGRQYLEMVASIRGCRPDDWPCGDLIEPLALARWMKARIGDCSLGTKMKISLAAALLGGPKLLILDESLNGMDPVANWRVRNILANLVREGGHAVILSTHMVETVAATCTDVIFLESGRVIHRWTTEGIAAAQAEPGGFEGLVMHTLTQQEGVLF
jgi:ABC-2 type transport system ATP-binding protein